MSSATTSEKLQSNPPTSTSSTSESQKEKPGSDVSTKHNDSKDRAHEGFLKLFREAKEKIDKMSPEERAKTHAWVENYKHAIPCTHDELPEGVWDDI